MSPNNENGSISLTIWYNSLFKHVWSLLNLSAIEFEAVSIFLYLIVIMGNANVTKPITFVKYPIVRDRRLAFCDIATIFDVLLSK